ncbi:MAG: hypothetical protein OHK0022_26740 [Roseiflexaceae bacterium]
MALSVLFLVILALSGSLALLLIGATLRRRRVAGAMPFALLLCGELLWTAGAGLEPLVPGLEAKLLSDALQYLGRGLVVASALAFALIYTGRSGSLRRAALLLSIEPLITTALLLAEPLHGLARQAPRMIEVAGLDVLVYNYGPWLLFSAIYSYTLMLISLWLLMRYNRRRSELFRWQSRLVTLGLGAVFLTGLAMLAGHQSITELHSLDLTPLAFAVANPLWAVALFRSRLLDLIPVARDLLVEHIPDALIVVDDQGRVVDLNPRALRLLARPNTRLLGAPLATLLPEVATKIGGHDSATTGRISLRSGDSDEPVVVEGTVVPLSDRRDRPVGWQIVLRDITAQHQAEEALRSSQLLLQALLENSPLAVAVREAATGRYLLMNERMQQLLAPHQLPPEDGAASALDDPAPTTEPAPSPSPHQLERTLPLPDGTAMTLLETHFPLAERAGPAEAVGSIYLDITARKRAEEQLRESEKRFREVMEHVQLIGIMLDCDGVLTFCNEELLRVTGWRREQILGKNWFELFVPEQQFSQQQYLRYIAAEIIPDRFENDIRTASGESRRIAWHNTMVRDLRGQVIGTSSIGEDITARVQAEALLREREALFRLTFDQAPIGAALVGLDLRFTRVNAALCRITGYRADELVGLSFVQITHPEDLERDLAQAQFLARGEIAQYTLEKRYVRKDGGTVWVKLTSAAVLDEHGRPCYYLAQIEDISARKAAEEQLHTSQELLRGILDYAPTAIEVLDASSGRYLLVSDRTAAALGMSRTEVIGRTVQDLYPPDLATKWQSQDREIIANGAVIQTEDAVDESDGVTRTYLGTKFPIYAADGRVAAIGGIYTDITERSHAEVLQRQFERKLLETQRLESLGVLAGGIAHDFNNILAGIMGYAELALMDLDPTSEAYTAVGQIKAGARRAADLTNQMLAYAGKGRFVVRPVQLNSVVRESIELARGTMGSHSAVQIDLAESLPQIEADIAQMRQIVLNLLVNAAEALGPDGGSITVKTTVETLKVEDLQTFTLGADATPGCYVCLTVRDTGGGMDAATLMRIFDPFFTTKFTGRGLGLAAVHGIVRSHQGLLDVSSAPGTGTTFRIWLPALPVPCGNHASNPSPLNQGTLLVIDDESEVRTLLELMLPRLGYQVQTAADGPAGLRLFQQGLPDLVGVLVDLSMPGMSGDIVAQHIRAAQPDLPIILMSGYRAEDLDPQFEELSGVGFLHKPFSVQALMAVLTYPAPARP